MVVVKGSDVEIAWTFDNDISQVISRIWWFKKTGSSNFKRLAFIHFDDQDPTILNGSSLSRFEVVKPATLLLKNIDLDYTGTYGILLQELKRIDRSFVTVFVVGTVKYQSIF